MTTVSTGTPRRSTGSALFAAMPVLLGVFLLLAGVGLFAAIQMGFTATGARVRYQWRSACDAAAKPVLFARLEELGLPATPFGAGLDVQVQLPGKFEDEKDHLGQMLARRGKLEVYADGKLVTDHFKDVAFQLSLTNGVAVTLLNLDVEPPVEGTSVRIDGMEVLVNSITDGEVQLATTEEDPQRAVREATDRVVVLRHPLPCDLQLVRAEVVELTD